MLILNCSEAAEMCANLKPFLNIIKLFLQILRWTIPILLIVLGSIDMFKAMANANDEKVLADARQNLIKRLIYGVVVFLIPFLINVILELVGNAIKTEDTINVTTWIACWNETVDMSSCEDIYTKDNNNYENEDNNTTEETNSNTDNKVCYSWTIYTCEKGTYDSKYGDCIQKYNLDSSILSELTAISSVWKYYNKYYNQGEFSMLTSSGIEYCENKLGKEPNSLDFEIESNKTDGSSVIKSFVCLYKKAEEIKYSSSQPKKTATGKYKKYECINTNPGTNCENYSFCNDVGEFSVK